MQRISQRIFLLTPENVEVSAEEKARLIERASSTSRRSAGGPKRPPNKVPLMKLGFVGAGNMAGGLARGWAAAQGEPGAPESMAFADADPDKARKLAEELGGEAVEGNVALADNSDLVVLAVKPKVLDEVAPDLVQAGTPVLSILAGTPLKALHEALPGIDLIRVMPNLGAQLRQGVLCLAFPKGTDDARRRG